MNITATNTEAQTLEAVIRARHSVRHYDPSVRIPREEVEELLALANLAPSSSNLQHWRYVILDTEERKAALHPIANSQQQVLEAAVVVVILGDTQGYRKAKTIYEKNAEAGNMPAEMAKSFGERTEQVYSALPRERSVQIAVTDASLAAMQLMLVAKARGYDTVPMGGFDAEKLKTWLGLGERYVPVMLLPIGKATQPGHPTYRLPASEVAFWNELPAAERG